MPLTIHHVYLCPTISQPIDGLMSLSFWIDFWSMGHGGLGWIYTGLGSACGFSGEHASMLTTTGTSVVQRQRQTTQGRFAARLRHECYSRLPDCSAPSRPLLSDFELENLASWDRWMIGGLGGNGWGGRLEERVVAHLTIFSHTWLSYLLEE